jgi:hypothetical protein
MTKKTILLSALNFVLILAVMTTAALGADVTGTWTASFDTQVGAQKYLYV